MKWISVKDELPDIYSDVLIYTNRNGGYFDIGYIGPNGHWHAHGCLIVADVLCWAELEEPVR